MATPQTWGCEHLQRVIPEHGMTHARVRLQSVAGCRTLRLQQQKKKTSANVFAPNVHANTHQVSKRGC